MYARSCALPPCPFRDLARAPRDKRRDGDGSSASSTSTGAAKPPSRASSRASASASGPATRTTDTVTVPVSEAVRLAREGAARGSGRRRGTWRDAMAFGGWAPETVNSRCAMVGIVCGEAAKRVTGDGFVTLAHDHVVSVVSVVFVVTLASFAPSAFGAEYGGDPKSKRDVGAIMTARKEKIHGRLAMMAIAYEVAMELSSRGFF